MSASSAGGTERNGARLSVTRGLARISRSSSATYCSAAASATPGLSPTTCVGRGRRLRRGVSLACASLREEQALDLGWVACLDREVAVIASPPAEGQVDVAGARRDCGGQDQPRRTHRAARRRSRPAFPSGVFWLRRYNPRG
eukprot:scaffold91001_cov32-Tisochrysis_lutea.AAC.1